MANALGLGVFGTFGQPDGFQQAFSSDCHFVRSLDIDNDQIELFPNTELFAVKKEVVKDVYAVSFSIYTFVREMNANRNTTFLGSCILLQGVYIDAEKIYKLVRELQNDLLDNIQNVSNNTIQVRKVVNLAVKEPTQFQSVKFGATPIKDTSFYSDKIDPQKKYFIKTEHIESASQVISFFDEALKNFNDTESLYFTFSDKIINAVNKKGKLDVLDWDQFINYKNHVKQDLVTTKQQLKYTPPDIIATPVIDNTPEPQIAPPEETIRGNESNTTMPEPLPQVRDEEVIHDPDFAFDGWGEPTRGWAIDEATKKAHEYNRLLAYAKHLKTRNEDLLDQQQKNIARDIADIEDAPEQQQKQQAWDEIAINNTNREENEGYEKRNNRVPFYKKRLFVFILFGALLVFISGIYIAYKKHIFKKQALATEETTNTPDSANMAAKPLDTTRPAEHPPITDSAGQK